MRMCFDKRVLAGLGAVAIALFAFAPQALGAAAPLLVMAACPLSMVVMVRALNRGEQCETADPRPVSEPTAAQVTPASERVDGQPRLRELEAEVQRLQAELSRREETTSS